MHGRCNAFATAFQGPFTGDFRAIFKVKSGAGWGLPRLQASSPPRMLKSGAGVHVMVLESSVTSKSQYTVSAGRFPVAALILCRPGQLNLQTVHVSPGKKLIVLQHPDDDTRSDSLLVGKSPNSALAPR